MFRSAALSITICDGTNRTCLQNRAARQPDPISHSPLVRLVQILPFLHFFEQEIGSADEVLERFGLDRDMVDNPDLFVHAEIIYGLTVGFAGGLRATPFLGTRIGEWLPISARVSFEDASKHARTVGEFLTRWLQEVPSEATSVRHTMIVGPARATYAVDRVFEPRNSPAQAEGFATAQYSKLFEIVSSMNWDPAEVEIETRFAHAIPPDYKGFRITNRQVPGLRLSIPTSWLHALIDRDGLVGAASISKKMQSPPPATVSASVRAAARHLIGGEEVSPAAVARAIGLSAEAVTRSLRSEGTTLARELREVKLEIACAALKDPGRSITQIAGELGFSEAANFTRFFRSNKGVSPRAYRAALDR